MIHLASDHLKIVIHTQHTLTPFYRTRGHTHAHVYLGSTAFGPAAAGFAAGFAAAAAAVSKEVACVWGMHLLALQG